MDHASLQIHVKPANGNPMPTENRSSNTELISQAASAIEDLLANGTGAIAAAAWASLPADLRKLTAQPHPEPIAWMVGTAVWWTKEEAERDAAATGLPVVPVGPLTDPGEVERLRAELADLKKGLESQVVEGLRADSKWLRDELDKALLQLDERDALLIEVLPSLDLAAGAFKSAKPVRNKVKAAISASAEPEAT